MKIPLPIPGYWAKVKAGKKVTKRPLSDNYTGKTTLKIIPTNREALETKNSRENTLLREIEQSLQEKLIVPDRLTNPDSLIIAARENLKENNRHWPYKDLVMTRSDKLSIRVSPENVSRALRILDTLIKALRKRGHYVEARSSGSYAVVNGIEQKFVLREKLKKVPVVEKKNHWDTTEFHSTGILCFKLEIWGEKEWRDGKLRLEDQLSKIILKMEIMALETVERREQAQKELEARRAEEARRLEHEKLQQEELSKFKKLLQDAHRWQEVKVLREYIRDKKAISVSGMTEDKAAWFEWAQKKLDWYDPTVDAEDELLYNVDKATLTLPPKKTSYYW